MAPYYEGRIHTSDLIYDAITQTKNKQKNPPKSKNEFGTCRPSTIPRNKRAEVKRPERTGVRDRTWAVSQKSFKKKGRGLLSCRSLWEELHGHPMGSLSPRVWGVPGTEAQGSHPVGDLKSSPHFARYPMGLSQGSPFLLKSFPVLTQRTAQRGECIALCSHCISRVQGK